MGQDTGSVSVELQLKGLWEGEGEWREVEKFKEQVKMLINPLPTNDAYMRHELP